MPTTAPAPASTAIDPKAFKTFDCEILEGSNGVEGLAVATREKPDVIILD